MELLRYRRKYLIPRQYLMYRVPDRKGWMKWTKFGSYSVSCRQLGAELTKDASWKAANDWWQGKEAELGSVAALLRLADQGLAARKMLNILERASIEGAEHGEGTAPMPLPELAAMGLGKGDYVSAQIIDGVLTEGLPFDLPAELREWKLDPIARRITPRQVHPGRSIASQVEGWVKCNDRSLSPRRSWRTGSTPTSGTSGSHGEPKGIDDHDSAARDGRVRRRFQDGRRGWRRGHSMVLSDNRASPPRGTAPE